MRIFTCLFTKALPKTSDNFSKTWNLIFGKYLLTTNIVSSGLLMSAGDVMSQRVEFYFNKNELKKMKIDWNRVGLMFVVGALQGPVHHIFYNYMDRFLPKTDLKTVFKKILADQLFMSPLCIGMFFYSAGFLEGKTIPDCTNEIKKKFITVYTTDWIVWPPTQFINFYFFAPKYRVFYVNFMTMLYDVFLSYIKHVD